MKLLLVIVGLVAAAFAVEPQRPRPDITPGATRPVTVKVLCGTSTRSVRHTDLSTKTKVCRAYGIAKGCPGPKWEIDHLVSLELGGADEAANLWPQPITEAREKDQLENRLHREVCAGTISLKEAQGCIAMDWVFCYAEHMQ